MLEIDDNVCVKKIGLLSKMSTEVISVPDSHRPQDRGEMTTSLAHNT